MLTVEDLKNSVDPMTGVVRFPVTLVELPGIQLLNTTLRISYGGSVQLNVATWNLQASTGSVGLGWFLEQEFIALATQQNGANSDNEYFYFGGEGPTRLILITDSGASQTYLPERFQPWLFTYTSATETWTVVKEDGSVYTFGGGATAGNGPRPSTGNSVQWGVKIGPWIGSGIQTVGQAQYALLWNLSHVTAPTGEALNLTYTAFSDDIIPVGTNGLPYTRASYLSTVTDTNNRTLTLNYAAKTAAEYQSPHVTSGVPNAYQDRYETRYLSSIVVTNGQNATLMSVQPSYSLMSQGTTTKRLLIGLTKQNGQGASLPGVNFSYFDSSAGNQAGFLKSVTVPSGATVSYTMAQGQTSANRVIPVDLDGNTKPRFYFHPGYVATTQFTSNKFAAISAYTWDGQWIADDLGEVPINDQYDNLQIATEDEFFAVFRPKYTISHITDGQMRLCHRQIGKPGDFSTQDFDLPELNNDSDIRLVSGERYAALLGTTSGILITFTYNGQTWIKTSQTLSNGPLFAVAGRHNYLLTTARPNNSPSESVNAQLRYLDGSGAWQTGFSGSVVTTATDATGLELYSGDAYAILRVKNYKLIKDNYRYLALNWSSGYGNVQATCLICSDSDAPTTGYVANVRGSMVGIDTRLFRYDGADWDETLDLASNDYRYPHQTAGRTLAYGFDKVVRRVEISISGEDVQYMFDVTEYFPASQTWGVGKFKGANLPTYEDPGGFVPVASSTIRFPSNYVLLGNAIYYEAPDFSWSQVGTIPESVVNKYAASVELVGSSYVAYQSDAGAVIQLLQNGTALAPVTLNGQTVYASSLGASLVGPGAFVTFTGSLDNPTTIQLNAVTANAFQGTIANPVVTQIQVQDGFDTQTTGYAYTAATAVADASGYVNRHNKTSIYASGSAATPTFGHQERFFFNGLPNNAVSAPFPTVDTNCASYYGLLTGIPYQQSDFDAQGNQVAISQDSWTVTLAQLANVTRSTRSRLTTTVGTVDQRTSSLQRTYDPTTGLLTQTQTTNTNSVGATETIVDATYRAWQAYSPMQARNMLVQVAQQKRTIDTIATSIEATTWQDWGSGQWMPGKTYKALVNTTDFNFASWSGSNEPPTSTWLKTGAVLSRTPLGLPIKQLTIDGTYDSALYDQSQKFGVARFTNASAGDQEAGYLGFETYEGQTGWQIASSASVIATDSHTGSACLRATAGGGSAAPFLQRAFQPATQAGASYVFSAWVKTESGFGQDGGTAFLTVTLSTGGSQTVPITDTNGGWSYFCTPPIATPNSGTATLTVSATNQKSTVAIRLDDVAFAPALGAYAANVYGGPYLSLIAEVLTGGETRRQVFDTFTRPIASIGPVENVNELSFQFLARQSGATNSSPTLANTASSLVARNGGAYVRFADGWQSAWQTTGSGWNVSRGALQYTGSGAGTAKWLNYDGAANIGVRVGIAPISGSQPTGAVSLAIGTTTVGWTPDSSGTGGRWSLNGVLANNPVTGGVFPYATNWALASIDGRVFFWADGWLIFDTVPSSYPGQIVLNATPGVAFSDFLTFEEPIVTVGYTDGLTNARQNHTMDGANTAVVAETVYDPLARAAIQSKSALKTVSSPSNPLFAYWSKLITNGGNHGSLWQTGVMQGDIAVQFPFDAGYCYSRRVYEASPLGRVIETGLPGAQYAVGNHSTKFAYSSVPGGNLPANQYAVTTMTNPDGIVAMTVADRQGNIVLEKTTQNGAVLATTTYGYTWTTSGLTTTTYPPSSYAPPPGTTATDFVTVSQSNYLGQVVNTSSKTEGVAVSIFTPSGRLRFRMTADGVNPTTPSADSVQYFVYDPLARPIESGLIAVDWSTLPALAPDSYTPSGTKQRRGAWSYYPPNVVGSGRIQQGSDFPAGSQTADAVRSFTYDAFGNVASLSLLASGYDATTRAINYTYDNLGNRTSIAYNDAASTVVAYRYNRRGLVSIVMPQAGGPAYASYLYNPDDSMAAETLSVFEPGSNTFSYNSPGWKTGVTYKNFAQSLNYTAPGYNNVTYNSGLVAIEGCSQIWNPSLPNYANTYGYDGLSRLQYSENSISTDWGIGIGKGVQYDANGNLLALNRGNINFNYAYVTANRLNQITGQQPYQMGYSPSGRTVAATPTIQTIAYDGYTGFPTQVTAGTGTTLSYQYNDLGQRVLKTTTASSATTKKLYLHGTGETPLMERVKDQTGTETVTLYVYSPNGLVAFIRSAIRYATIKDALGSIRTVLDNTGNVAASFDYLPFGVLMRTAGDPTIIDYRYTGQEFDQFGPTLADGLYNFRTRLYDCNIARFYGPDPANQDWSPYVYVGNNPVGRIDPTGMSWKIILGELGAAFVLGAAAFFFANPVTLAIATGAIIAGSIGAVAGAMYGIHTNASVDKTTDYIVSFGLVGASAVVAGSLSLAVGFTNASVAMQIGFGVYNGISMAPAGTSYADSGYYILAGIAISFGTQMLALSVTARVYTGSFRNLRTANTLLNASKVNAPRYSTAANRVFNGVSNASSETILSSVRASNEGRSPLQAALAGMTLGVVAGSLSYGLSFTRGANSPVNFWHGPEPASIKDYLLTKNGLIMVAEMAGKAGPDVSIRGLTMYLFRPAFLGS